MGDTATSTGENRTLRHGWKGEESDQKAAGGE